MKKLSDSQFDTAYNKALKSFGLTGVREVTQDIYRMRITTNIRFDMDRLWLYIYALNTWDNVDITNNYLTEEQMTALVHAVQRMKL